MKKQATSFVKEFKDFISRGNVVDLAVGVIIGGAFSKIITSLVNDIIMPLVGILIGGKNFSTLYFKVGNAFVTYGSFLQNVIDFLIVAFCIFTFVKILNKFKKKEEEKAPEVNKSEVLLTEIRDLLKKSK